MFCASSPILYDRPSLISQSPPRPSSILQSAKHPTKWRNFWTRKKESQRQVSPTIPPHSRGHHATESYERFFCLVLCDHTQEIESLKGVLEPQLEAVRQEVGAHDRRFRCKSLSVYSKHRRTYVHIHTCPHIGSYSHYTHIAMRPDAHTLIIPTHRSTLCPSHRYTKCKPSRNHPKISGSG